MKLIHSNYEILEQGNGLDGINEQIELAGRTCYKSEDKITEDSAKDFVDRMIKSGHGAMLEHGTVYLAIPMTTYAPEAVNSYRGTPYARVNQCNEFIFTDRYGDKVSAWCVTTNYRFLIEHDILEDLEFICEPTKYHEKRITVKFTCDRGVSHEFVRHRVFSFAQESTRYCNYTKDKFGNELTFIVNDELHDDENATGCDYHNLLENIELTYLQIIKDGYTAQQARTILPNALKTELVMTGFASDWKGFFKLRDNSKAHPDARALAKPLHEEFIKKGYIDGNLD
jgi:thymidylate synthase (FAD)